MYINELQKYIVIQTPDNKAFKEELKNRSRCKFQIELLFNEPYDSQTTKRRH